MIEVWRFRGLDSELLFMVKSIQEAESRLERDERVLSPKFREIGPRKWATSSYSINRKETVQWIAELVD